MKLFNTMSMTKEDFVPIEKDKVRIYVCGPTVYNYIHIGNARPIIVFDVLRRYLEYRGYDVTFVQNFTDIEDKIINRAKEEGTTCQQVSQKYIDEYFKDARGLGVIDADIHPLATDNIDGIIEIVEKLIEKDKAYVSHGDVYFRTDSFADYGKLSNQPRESLQAGARVDVSEIKENPMDFVLWKGAKPGEPMWDSPWGKGRPGWHIECSAMVKRYLGDTIDIHCGGHDLTFPHHENEIAQSESISGKPFVNYWLHNGYLNMDGKKMSKSLGNFSTAREAAEEYGYENIRMFMLMSHYRSPMNYSGELLVSAKTALDRIKNAYNNFSFIAENGSDDGNGGEIIDALPEYRQRFITAMDDDLNTADAIAVIFELIREANGRLSGQNPSSKGAKAVLQIIDEFDEVLGLLYAMDQGAEDDDAEKIEGLIEERKQARQDKNWERADQIRDELTALGVVVEDTPQGAKWKRI